MFLFNNPLQLKKNFSAEISKATNEAITAQTHSRQKNWYPRMQKAGRGERPQNVTKGPERPFALS
jgi:hypothetical protein